MPTDGRIRVLVVDDSAIVRKILTEALSGQPDLEVVGTAPDPYIARDKILSLQPDVLTLDIEMPRMDGLTFLKKLMHFRPMPVIVISSLAQASCQTAMQALSLGAVEVLAKPGGPYSVGELRLELASKIRAAAAAHIRPAADVKHAAPATPPPRLAASQWTPSTVIAIGASTGGTEAIANILPRLPQGVPGIVITQHIPAGFSRAFATRLNQMCAFEVKEAEDGDTLRPGRALVAPGDLHMLFAKAPTVIAWRSRPARGFVTSVHRWMSCSVPWRSRRARTRSECCLRVWAPTERRGCSRCVRPAHEPLRRMNPLAWSSACLGKPSAPGLLAAWWRCPESRRRSWPPLRRQRSLPGAVGHEGYPVISVLLDAVRFASAHRFPFVPIAIQQPPPSRHTDLAAARRRTNRPGTPRPWPVSRKRTPPTRTCAYSERWRSAFRGDGDHDSELMPIAIPR